MARAALVILVACVLVAGAQGGTTIIAPPPVAIRAWTPESDNLIAVHGTAPPGSRLRVDGYALAPTDSSGRWTAFVDGTLLARHVVTGAGAQAAIIVAYPLRDVKASGTTITGRLVYTPATAPPPVGLYTYELRGTVTDANGRPVEGAYVSTRTVDRDYWTVSSRTDAQGRYSSLFTASDEAGHNPVPMTVRVARGDLVYQFLRQEYVRFPRLQSAQLDLRLPPKGYPLAIPQPRSYPGAIYEGLVVGASVDGTPVRPARVTWPDARGRFTIVLPASLRGRSVSLWEGKLDLFSTTAATPGSAVDLRDWPRTLAANVPRDLARVTLR